MKNDKILREIDHFEFSPTANSLIKSEKVMLEAHHDGSTPLPTVLNLNSPDAEKSHPAGAMMNMSKVVTPVRSSYFISFLTLKRKINYYC